MGDIVSNVFDTALVFEGGGMRASYTSAMVATLLGAGIHLDWVGGISAGSSNTANYVSRDAARARKSFVEFAAEPRFGSWRTFVRGQGYFSAEWIYEHTSMPGQPLPFDWKTWEANPARVRIGGVRCSDGATVYWGREDLTSLPALMKRVRASSTMPVLMPICSVDGEDYVDGALGTSGGIPLDAAEADGFEKFLVILTRPKGYRKSPAGQAAFYRRHFRRYPAVAEAILTRHERYNATLDRLEQLEREGRAYVFRPTVMPVGNSERNVSRLAASYGLGYAQAQRELPQIRRFLGLPEAPAPAAR